MIAEPIPARSLHVPADMLHFTAHVRHRQLLFSDWVEARFLWDRIVERLPVHALVLMPDHLHLVTPRFDASDWGVVARGYVRWRNRRHACSGKLFFPYTPPRPVPDRQHLDRLHRYVLLNPCRGGLVQDPLEWPFSTHRDRVGYALPGAVAAVADPAGFHRHISSDATTDPTGTSLPEPSGELLAPGVAQIARAVSSLTRTPAARLRARGPARTFLIRALRVLTPLSAGQIADALGLSASAVSRTPAGSGPDTRLVERVLGDGRFRLLADGDLSRTPGWARYGEIRDRKRFRHAPTA